MATKIQTTIDIQASPAQVWEVLINTQEYPAWNPFITSIEGELAIGNRIKATIGKMNFTPTILAYEQNKKLEWLGHLLLPKLFFDGKHSFTLTANPDGTTTLIHSEVFTGLLVPLFKKQLMTETKAGFEAMNQALKARVEEVD